jgi:MraZ protein
MVSSGDADVTTVRLEQTQVDLGVAPLCGTYRHHVDEKGRVAIPAQMRRSLPEGSMVATAAENRLMIWPPDAWALHTEVFLRTAETEAQRRRFMRILHAKASNFEVDAQGRLLLTAPQRAFAQIVDQVVFVGIGTGVEVIADAIWKDEEEAITPEEFTQLWDVVHQRGTSASSSPA